VGGNTSKGCLGMAILSSGANGGNTPPTATQPYGYPIIVGDSGGFTESYSISDQTLNISPGTLNQWFSKVMMVGTVDSRYWVGLSDSTYTSAEPVMNSNTPAANFIGFRFASNTDTHIQAVCQISSTQQTVVSTGIVPTTTVPQVLKVASASNGATMTFYINGNFVATISTNIPLTSTALGSYVGVDGYGSVDSTGQIDTYYIYALLNA